MNKIKRESIKSDYAKHNLKNPFPSLTCNDDLFGISLGKKQPNLSFT